MEKGTSAGKTHCDADDTCVSMSVSSDTDSSRSSEWKHIYEEIQKEVAKLKEDEEAVARAEREAAAGQTVIPSEKLVTLWMKIKSPKNVSLIKGNVVVYSCESYLLFYDINTGERSVFTPDPVEKNNGVGFHIGHPSQDVVAVAQVSINPKIHIVHYPSMETIAEISDNSVGHYESICFSGERMLMTLKFGLKLHIAIWDWKNKFRYFNIERESYSNSLSLRGASDASLFSLLCLGKPSKLYIWEMSIFSDIVSLFSKHCSEEKELVLKDQCLFHGNCYAVNDDGDVYKAQKESSDHLKFIKIIEHEEEINPADPDKKRGPFIVGMTNGLAVYGPEQSVKIYKKVQGNWICERVTQLPQPLEHLLSTPNDNFLIGWDSNGLVKIDSEVKSLEDTRIMSENITSMAVIHPNDVIVATLMLRKKIQFWTIDQGFYISQYKFTEDVKNMTCHPMLPYLIVSMTSVGDIHIIDVQSSRRPKLVHIVSVTFEPLHYIEFNPKGTLMIAAGNRLESIYLIQADPSKSFDVHRAAITRHPFSSFAVLMGAQGREWVVLLLTNYRNVSHRYLELLTIPGLIEFIKLDLGQSYSQILTSQFNPSSFFALMPENVIVTRIHIDTKKGKIKEKEVVGREHIVPPVLISQDLFHLVTYGGRDGYLVLYASSGQIIKVAPHRLCGVQYGAFATRIRTFLTLTKDSTLSCFKLVGSCGHDDSHHILSCNPYKYLPREKAKIFKIIPKDEIPWDEIEGNQRKIMIYKKGLVRTVGKGIRPDDLLTILNTTDCETKIKTIKECSGHFDHEIVINYIRKWITHYRSLARRFVEYNEYLEKERPAEMIPWSMIQEVESRAYAEYKQAYEENLSKFKDNVEASINKWSIAYQRIIENTWQTMQKQPTSVKMIFRDFNCMDFGLSTDYKGIYNEMEHRIGMAFMDYYLHPATENFIWDARFEVFDNYWEQYLKYLTEGVQVTEESMAQKSEEDQEDDEIGDGDYLVENLSRFLEDETSDQEVSNVFKKRMLEGTQASYSSVARIGPIKRAMDVASNILLRKEGTLIEMSGKSGRDIPEGDVEMKESDESLFHDSEEEMLANKPNALKRYKKYKKRTLKKIISQYPYADEFKVETFNDLFKVPSDFPDECMFVRPAISLISSQENVQKEEESEKTSYSKMSQISDAHSLSIVSAQDETEAKAPEFPQTEKQEEEEEEKLEEDLEAEREIEEMEELLTQVPSQKMLMAKRIVDSDYEAEMMELARQQHAHKKSKKGKKEVSINVAEDVSSEIEPLTKEEENRLKRVITHKAEKPTDKLDITTINEYLIKKGTTKPTNALAVSDLSRLYLILDVDILIESNRKRRKRRKSSLDREAMNQLKLFAAESKNTRMTRLLTQAQDQSIKRIEKLKDRESDPGHDSSSSEDIIDLRKAKAFVHGAPLNLEKQIRKKVLIVGDILWLKKRRLILGRIKERTPDEKLKSDLQKLGIEGQILPPNYVIVKRQDIFKRLNQDNIIKIGINPEEEEEEEEEEDAEEDLALKKKKYTLEELCWLESAQKMFEASKLKKTGAEVTAETMEEEETNFEAEDMAFSIKTKVSVLSTMKAMLDGDTERQSIDTKKEMPRLYATTKIETVEDGMAFLMEGTAAANYISMGPMTTKNQLNLSTVLTTVVETAYDVKSIYDVYLYFNEQFDKLKKVKEGIMNMIQKHQENYLFYIDEIRLACKEQPDFPEMPPAVYSARENPVEMINVYDSEIPVSRYYSPSELSLIKRLEEEEALRRRKPKPDPFRLEALQVMMDGVVERRWEDELRKDIPYPKALKDVDPEEWEQEEIELNLKYEEDVRLHNAERQKYRKILNEKINEEIEAIRTLHMGFDLRVKQMNDKQNEFIQIEKELKMFFYRRFKDKAFLMAFLSAAERARAFTEATKASVDQIESLVKALGKKMRSHKAKMTSLKKKKEQREEKLESTLKKMGVITADRSFVIMNYIRPTFVINSKYLEISNLLVNAVECFDNFGDCDEHSPMLVEFFKDIALSLKRNVPQKLTKQIWEILSNVRKENIKDDIQVQIFQLEYNKAEDAAKFFKAYLKQKQSFTELISKTLENSVQRYRTSQYLQEFQVVLPMGMVEINVGWEQDAIMPNSSDLIIIPGEDYQKLLNDRHSAEKELTSQQWRNSVSQNNIARFNTRHYELISRNKLLNLNIKHIERYQLSMTSRSLIKEIKESGLRLGGDKTTKRTGHSVTGESEEIAKREGSAEEIEEYEEVESLDTGKHFILSDMQKQLPEYDSSDYEAYPVVKLQEPKATLPQEKDLHKTEPADSKENDILMEKPFKYLFDEEYEFVTCSDSDGGSQTSRLSRISLRTKHSKHSTKFSSKYSKVKQSYKIRKTFSDKSAISRPSANTIDKRSIEKISTVESSEPTRKKKERIRKLKKVSSSIIIRRTLSFIRLTLLSNHAMKIFGDSKSAYQNFLENIEDVVKFHSWRGLRSIPEVQFDKIDKFELAEEEVHKERSEFQLVKAKFIKEAKRNIQRNNEIWYPKLSARDAELFKKDTGIDFDKYLEIPKDVQEVYDYDIKGPTKPTEEKAIEAPATINNEEVNSEYFERKKREFAFTGSWPERLVALWKELEGAEQATKQLEKLIMKSKKTTVATYWNFSDFNFKRNMKNNLVSLLKSYKNQVERHRQDSKAMEREMTRYIEMNKKCVILFFNYEMDQGKVKGDEMEEMTRRTKSFINKQNAKVEKAMKKAQLLREVQENQYEILQLQSELELLQLRTYPILMYKLV